MKLIGNLFQGKPASLEEGSVKCHSTNKYLILHPGESGTNCVRFVQILKVILCIQIIIFIGWLGCVSFSYYNTDRNTDCGVSTIGCKSLKIDYNDTEVKNSRVSRSVGDTEDEREKCERNVNATRRKLNSLAAQFVIGESSDPTVVQLRRKYTIFMIRSSLQVVFNNEIAEVLVHAFLSAMVLAMIPGSTASNTPTMINTTHTNPYNTMPDNILQEIMEHLNEEFVNLTDSTNRQRLARGPSTIEMTREFRIIAESVNSNIIDCNISFLRSLLSVRKFNLVDMLGLILWNGRLLSELTLMGCREAEAQLLEDRRDRLEAIAAEMASDHQPGMSTIILLNAIESALNATSPSEVTVEDHLLQYDSGLIPWKRYVSNASLELKKEFYELVRDKFLELRNESNRSSSWEGYDLDKAYGNWTDGPSILTEREKLETVLNITITFGEAFNLHYVEAERQNNYIISWGPAFGTLTYLGAEPEKLDVRRLRHILNGFVRLSFRVHYGLEPCQLDAGHGLGIDVS